MGIIENMKRNASYKDCDLYRPGAFNPGLFKLNKKKLKDLRPQIFGLRLGQKNIDTWQNIHTQLNDGDIQPALVMSASPLLVACYADDMDAVAMHCFPEELGRKLGWTPGRQLIVTAAYNRPLMKANRDLDCGPRSSGRFRAYGPIVADLYTDNTERLERKKREISMEMWTHVERLARQYMANHPGMARNGLGYPYADAEPIEEIKFNAHIKLD